MADIDVEQVKTLLALRSDGLCRDALITIKQLQTGCRTLEMGEAKAMALVMSYEGRIEQLQAENQQLRQALQDELPQTLMPCPQCEIYGVSPRDGKLCLRCQLTNATAKIATLEDDLAALSNSEGEMHAAMSDFMRQRDEAEAETKDLKARLSEVMAERDKWHNLYERMRIDNDDLRTRLK